MLWGTLGWILRCETNRDLSHGTEKDEGWGGSWQRWGENTLLPKSPSKQEHHHTAQTTLDAA